jgi:uncharacterized protein (DUF58 family)
MAKLLTIPDWTQWLRIARTEETPATLSRRHIYILPTAYGWLFAFVLLLMLIGSINYSLSLGFVLVFLLVGIANMAILHTWRNLVHLQIAAGKMQPVFAGEDACIEILIADNRHRARYAIASELDPADKQPADLNSAEPVYVDIPSSGLVASKLHIPSERRGWLAIPRIKIHTEFPLTLFHAWAYVDLNAHCLIYPRPAATTQPIPSSPDQDVKGTAKIISGDDDFSGHRTYRFGDSPKRVDWKASAREQGIFTKQFQGSAQSAVWLDWANTPGSDDEQRICQLTRWILDADIEQRPYGLRLPGRTFSPNIGKAHFHQCLQALALM